MKISYFCLILFLMILTTIKIIFFNKKTLMMLISMEYLIMVMMSLMFIHYFNENNIEILTFMVMAICESILGLTLLLVKTMITGMENIKIMNAI